ncbi:MAG: FHA domain-containing protein [Planctomycetes bacterium]|nr:FHA domain-containing protein [Planctomycetota bacterium]
MLEQLFSFVSVAHKNTREQFVRAHPEPVFVIEPFVASAEGPGKFGTIAGPAGSGQETSVARIKKRAGANAFDMMVTIGRARNNDIEVRAQDVSKFHAYIMFAPGGEASITDAGSTYGTFVRGRQLRPREDKVPLAPGDEVKLGSVVMRYHTPASFFDYLRAPS